MNKRESMRRDRHAKNDIKRLMRNVLWQDRAQKIALRAVSIMARSTRKYPRFRELEQTMTAVLNAAWCKRDLDDAYHMAAAIHDAAKKYRIKGRKKAA